MEVENEIQFTDVCEVAVENLYEVVDDFQDVELIVVQVYTHAKVEAGVALVHHAEASPFNEIAEFGPSGDDGAAKLTQSLEDDEKQGTSASDPLQELAQSLCPAVINMSD